MSNVVSSDGGHENFSTIWKVSIKTHFSKSYRENSVQEHLAGISENIDLDEHSSDFSQDKKHPYQYYKNRTISKKSVKSIFS